MKALILQHEIKNPPGAMLEWLNSKKTDVKIHLTSNGFMELQNDFDLLIILGGSMNVDEVQSYPWLLKEKEFIAKAIAENKKIVGICLGAQLLAELLGGKVFKAPAWEAGWQDIRFLKDQKTMKVFQWHGCQFVAPDSAEIMAESESCPHQGFKMDQKIWGVQFHPEATLEWIKERTMDADAPPPGPCVQSAAEMLSHTGLIRPMREWFFNELDSFLAGSSQII